MKSINNVKKSRIGRPAADTEAVTLRLPREILAKIEEYRRKKDDIPTRQEAIRLILSDWFDTKGI